MEVVSRQAVMDLVDQPPHRCSSDTDHQGRCHENQFAEEQGRLSQRWFRLQATLNCQVREPGLG